MKGKIKETSPGRFEVWFGRIHKRFRGRIEAERFLTGVRYEEDKGSFDPRDYQRDKPLGFATLANKWLAIRKREVRDYNSLRYAIFQSISYFENRNIKSIGYGELEDFYSSLPEILSGKSKANIFTTLHSFWVWVSKREKIQIPEFPKIKFELKRRKTITHEQQQEILAWLKERAPFKVWLGIKWLATYISIRPGELRNIKEGDIDREQGVIYVKDNKGRKTKTIPLLDQDRAIIRDRALPHLYFFRHEQRKGVAPHCRQQFGQRCLYTWWKKCCGNLGINGVDLYGGTRHSSAQYLRLQGRTPEEIKRATGHTTTSSFNRYFEMGLDDLREIYGTGQVVEFKVKKEG